MEIKDVDGSGGDKIKIDVVKEAQNDDELIDVSFSHHFYEKGNDVILVLNVVSNSNNLRRNYMN